MGNYPLIAICGLDPAKHEIPPLLKHHLQKMAKDMPVVFLAEEDIDENVHKSFRELIKKTGFTPKVKEKIIKPKGNIIT